MAVALKGAAEYASSMEYMLKAQKIAPGDPLISSELVKVKEAAVESSKKEASLYKKMFS